MAETFPRSSPEYVEQLADIADPDQLWRHSGLDQMKFTPAQQRQLDAGVMLRRHAHHLRRLAAIRQEGRSMCITPLGPNSSAVMTIDPPPEHQKSLDARRDRMKDAL